MAIAAANGRRSTTSETEERIPAERLRSAYRWMLQSRLLDEKLASLYRTGRIPGGAFLGKGQEALSVAGGMSLRQGDIYAPLIRDGAGRLAFGESLLDAIRNCTGSPLGPSRGRDGNVHRGDVRRGYLPMISHLGAMLSVVNGCLMARRMKGDKEAIGLACVGDGASSTGAFHEALNQASVEKLPVVFVLANNQYAYSTPVSKQYACERLEDRAQGYGMGVHTADGVSLPDCLEKVAQATRLARQGAGPQLVVAYLLRLCGHGEHDDASYIDPALKESDVGRDCIPESQRLLLRKGVLTESELVAMRAEVVSEIQQAVDEVVGDPEPRCESESWESLTLKPRDLFRD